jgi:integrase
MSVRKRTWITSKDGNWREAWVVDYRDQNGDRALRTFSRKKDADAYHATVRVDVERGAHVAPSRSETVAEAAARWLKRVEADGRERTTLRQYRQHVNLHIGPRIGAVKLSNLTPPRVEAFRDDLVANLSRPMARKVLTSLKSLLKAAKRAHLAADVSIGRDKRGERKLELGVDIPTPEEIKRLLQAAADADIRPRTVLITAISTGLRASELRGLRWRDVDLKHAELHVRQRADRYCILGAPKTQTSVRTIDLGPRAVSALKEWRLACPTGEDGLVFPAGQGGPEHHKNMLRGLTAVMAAAGLARRGGRPKYALHSLRHYFASWCINRKAVGGRELPPKDVQQLLGHASIVMTLDRYGHLFPRGNDRGELAAAEAALWA